MNKTELLDIYNDHIKEFKSISGGCRLCFSVKTDRSRGIVAYEMWVPYRSNTDILFSAKTIRPFIYGGIEESFKGVINDKHAKVYLKLYEFIKSEFEEYKNNGQI